MPEKVEPENSDASRSETQVWTVGRILTWTKDYLSKSGASQPRLDAEVLLAHALGKSRIQLYTMYEHVLDDASRAAMRDFVKRRAQHEPVAYLVGHKEFFSLDFDVNSNVLIPRPETELLVMHAIEIAREFHAGQTLRILDLCTGSGCIAVSIAANLPQAQLTACDIHADALAVARRNATRHHVEERITFFEGDLWSALPSSQERFDILVTNPPYILQADLETLEPNVKHHEPRLALDGGTDGMRLIRPILEQAPLYLRPDGWLLMEFTPELKGPIQTTLDQVGQYRDVTWIKDLSGQLRHLRARLAT